MSAPKEDTNTASTFGANLEAGYEGANRQKIAEIESQALVQLIDSGNRIGAEIAARMMVADYPGSATARDCLARVMAMGTSLNSSDAATAPA